MCFVYSLWIVALYLFHACIAMDIYIYVNKRIGLRAMNCRAVIIHFVQVRPFILYCLFNEPPELYMFVGGGNKKFFFFKLQ